MSRITSKQGTYKNEEKKEYSLFEIRDKLYEIQKQILI